MPSSTFAADVVDLAGQLAADERQQPNTIARVPITVMPAARPRGTIRVRSGVDRLEQGREQERDEDRDDDLGQPRRHVEDSHDCCTDDQRAPRPLARSADAAWHGPVGRAGAGRPRPSGSPRARPTTVRGRAAGSAADRSGRGRRSRMRRWYVLAGQRPSRGSAGLAMSSTCGGASIRFLGGCALVLSFLPHRGAVAQLVARLVRNEKVRGSNPLSSTRREPRPTSVNVAEPGGVSSLSLVPDLGSCTPRVPRSVQTVQTRPVGGGAEVVQVEVRRRDRRVAHPGLHGAGIHAAGEPQAGRPCAAGRGSARGESSGSGL